MNPSPISLIPISDSAKQRSDITELSGEFMSQTWWACKVSFPCTKLTPSLTRLSSWLCMFPSWFVRTLCCGKRVVLRAVSKICANQCEIPRAVFLILLFSVCHYQQTLRLNAVTIGNISGLWFWGLADYQFSTSRNCLAQIYITDIKEG
jgi:hypothetical protein